ncbi:MAG: purine-nucleoside phosphorylase [Marinifilaceae bacterium]|nr:purine-nucleoside phosphorylase [Marinifilaceae bacterium]
MLRKIEESVNYLRTLLNGEYDAAIILGSGLGGLVNAMDVECKIPYSEIPNFPLSTVKGHSGNLLAGTFGGKRVLVMQGRFHFYEGYPMQQVTFPVRVLAKMGVKTLFVSNAAGGVNKGYFVGDMMVITDHINLFPEHPLRGKNLDEFGERFPTMVDAYSPRLRLIATEQAAKLGYTLRYGVYAGLQGPSYETPAEYHWLRVIGADAVGMSTVPEIIVARHSGIECFGISVITNSTASPKLIRTDHAEVQNVGDEVQPKMTALIKAIISNM